MTEQHDSTVTLRLFISGRVQGVGYRHWTVTEAKKRDISGWVRNLRDGRVEAVLRGEKEAVDDLCSACYKGPVFSDVTDIETMTGEYDGADIVEDIFEERPTV